MRSASFDKYVNNFSKSNFVYDSSHIEGNTIPLGDTEKLVKGILSSELDGDYSHKEVLEVKGLSKAYDKMMNFYRSNEKLSVELIRDLHDDVLLNNIVDSGQFRKHDVTAKEYKGKSIYTHWNFIEEDLEREVEYYFKDNCHILERISAFKVGFIVIHPFADGNGRTSRLLLNMLLMQNGYIPINIQYDDRDNYIGIMDKCRIEHNPDYFLEYMINILLNEYSKLIKHI